MEKECVDIIKSKSFEELSGDELNMLSEWCAGKEEFEGLKRVFTGVDILLEEDRSKNVDRNKTSLDHLFAEKHRKDGVRNLYPLLMVAAVSLVTLVTYIFWDKKEATYTARENRDAVKMENNVKENKPTKPQIEERMKEENVLTAQNSDTFGSIEAVRKVAEYGNTEKASALVDMETMDAMSEVSYSFSVPQAESSAMSLTRTEEQVFSHPDGVYSGRAMVKKSISLEEQQNILDLITPSF